MVSPEAQTDVDGDAPAWDDDLGSDVGQAGGQDGGQDPPAPVQYPSVDAWVSSWLIPVWTRDVSADRLTWCPQWWRHPEAVARLTALWQAWEQLRLEPGTAMSVWWRDHADHHLPILLDADTVFKGCSPTKGHTQYPIPSLPIEPPPPGLFDP